MNDKWSSRDGHHLMVDLSKRNDTVLVGSYRYMTMAVPLNDPKRTGRSQ